MLVGILIAVDTPYTLILPGTAEDVLPMISLSGPSGSGSGHLYLTTVYSNHANLLLYLVGLFSPDAELLREPGRRGRREKGGKMMEESRQIATAVALRKAGFPVTVRGQGVKILDIAPESRAGPLVEPGDVILAVDGQPTLTVPDLMSYLRKQATPRPVTLTLLRNAARISRKVPTLPRERGGIRIGIAVTGNGLEVKSPVEIRIDTRKIEGSSAGLMLALGIYQKLVHDDVMRGQAWAGTGTLDLAGKVGPVEGVRQKIRAAERVRARFFLCPVENYAEASQVKTSLVILPVHDLDEALRYLEARRGKETGLFKRMSGCA